MHKVVSQTLTLARAATKSGHKLHGVVQPPSKWAAEAGFQGSSASPLRQHFARQSSNGCGRRSRYPAVDAQGMVNLILYGTQFVEADNQAKQSAAAKRTRTTLDKARSASRQGARQAKAGTKAPVKAAKAKAPAKRQVKKEKTTA